MNHANDDNTTSGYHAEPYDAGLIADTDIRNDPATDAFQEELFLEVNGIADGIALRTAEIEEVEAKSDKSDGVHRRRERNLIREN